MARSNVLMLALFGSLAAASATAQEGRPACATCDEQQIGPYVAPDIELPDGERHDPRGRPVPIPVPGFEDAIRHRPGAGVWVGAAPGNSNLFLNPGRERFTLDMKFDF